MTTTSDRAAEILAEVFDVRDVRVAVTGAASGLGFTIAEVLAQCGARVTLSDVDAERLEDVTASLARGGARARAFPADVSDPGQVQALVDDVVAADGGLDVMFANAGIAATPGPGIEGGQRLDTVEDDVWNRVLGVNLHGVLYTMRAAAAVMRRQVQRGVADEETERRWTDMIPLGRMAVPAELRGLALLLASPASSFITGTALVIDGGALIK